MFLLFVLISVFQQLIAQPFSFLRHQLDLSPILNKHFYGFCLYDLDSNRFLLGVNDDKLFTPASNTKNFTLFTVLKNLGDSLDGLHYIERGDSLIFWGTADPTFLHNRLDSRKVYDFLKKTSKKLFYVAEKQMEEPFFRKGWAMEDFEEYYQPELSSFPIYGNVVTFRENRGQLRTSPVFFQSCLNYTNAKAGEFIVTRKFDENLFFINSSRIKHNYVNEKPFRYSDSLFVHLLSDSLKKEIKLISYSKPSDYRILHSHATTDILREMMLPSDNFLAEQLMMMTALKTYGEMNTAQLRKKMKAEYYDFLTDKIELYDGSGLSVYNKITPRSMVELLVLLYGIFEDKQKLHFLFPTGGVNGTLKRTYGLDQGEPFVWAKTGTINSVYNQSGFVRTRTGRNLAFSFLNTNFYGEATAVRKEVARVVTFIREAY